jgi:hypothetical protein
MKKLFILSTLAALFVPSSAIAKQWHLDKKKNKKRKQLRPEKT